MSTEGFHTTFMIFQALEASSGPAAITGRYTNTEGGAYGEDLNMPEESLANPLRITVAVDDLVACNYDATNRLWVIIHGQCPVS